MMFTRCGTRIGLNVKKFRLDIPIKPEPRDRKDIRPFVFDIGDYVAGLKDPVYLMYRGVSSLNPVFRKLEKKYEIRYDLTLIRNGLMGRQYIRTVGHHHPKNYSEIYEVIQGRAAFVLQSKDLKRMALILAKQGETVVIPPKFGHQTVNIGNTPLVIGNLVYRGFKSDYSIYKKKHGGAFYINKYTTPLWLMVNLNYGIAPIRFPKIKKLKGRKTGPIDRLFLKNPKRVADFLKGRRKSL